MGAILEANNRIAEANRAIFEGAGVVTINLMGSPGAGKTAVLERTGTMLAGRRRLGALAGDLATDNDARRLAAAGIVAKSITTGSACHLSAEMVRGHLDAFPWRELDYLFVENVGNLVCPAVYDLGQVANVVALSVTEGVDKPLKYPVMFRRADLVLITKIDLLPYLPQIQLRDIADALAHVMPEPRFFPVSATTGQGMSAWIDWLDATDHPDHVVSTKNTPGSTSTMKSAFGSQMIKS